MCDARLAGIRLYVYARSPVECITYLLRNPNFVGKMEYAPRAEKAAGRSRVYSQTRSQQILSGGDGLTKHTMCNIVSPICVLHI